MKRVRAAVVVAVTAAYVGYVLKIPQGTAFTTGLGDWIDPYFINALLEHWYRSLTRFTSPVSPPFFYPVTGVLGYSHGLVLYAPFYAVVRPFTHPFVAYTLTLFLVMETGALCLYGLLRRAADLGFIEALLLTMFFAASPNIINGYTGTWSQVLSVFLVPPILLMGVAAIRMPPGRLRLGLAALAGFLAALLMTQDAYTGLLTCLIAALLLAGTIVIEGAPAAVRRLRQVWQMQPASLGRARRIVAQTALGLAVAATLWTALVWAGGLQLFGITIESHHHHVERPAGVAAVALAVFITARGGLLRPLPRAFVIGAVAGALVFLGIYLGPGLAHRSFPAEQLLRSLAPRQLADWSMIFDHNRSLIAFERPRPFTLVLLVTLLAWMPRSGVPPAIRRYALWALLVAVFVALAALSLDGFSLWKTVFAPLPGFAIVRDPKRIIYAWELAVALFAGWFVGRLPRRAPVRMLVMLFVLGTIATDPNLTTFTFKRPIATFDRWVRAPIAINPSCGSFFVAGASDDYMARSGHMWSLYGIDATFIAMDRGLPTLNGYSAWTPDQWGLGNPQGGDIYRAEVARWVTSHGLQHVCMLDIDARTMTPYEQK